MGERWFRQEYLAVFEDPIGAVFSEADIQAAFREDVQPMVPKLIPAGQHVSRRP